MSLKQLKPGENPRAVMKNHHERSFARWHYTYKTIAEACGLTVDSVRHAASRRRGKPPALDMSDIRSVADYVVRHKKKRP